MAAYNLHDFLPIKTKTFALTNQRMILIWRDLRCECSRCFGFGGFVENERGSEVRRNKDSGNERRACCAEKALHIRLLYCGCCLLQNRMLRMVLCSLKLGMHS